MPQLYARVFLQILDSSVAEDWQVRHVFEDMLKLADLDGVVDMTRQAISRRTNVPLDVVERGLGALEAPDPGSRDQEDAGRRLVRLDEHRDWGWRIVNFGKYEAIHTSAEHRAAKARDMSNYRAKRKASPLPSSPSIPPNPDLTPSTDPSTEGRATCSLHVVHKALAGVAVNGRMDSATEGIGRTDGRMLPTADQLLHHLMVRFPNMPDGLKQKAVKGWLSTMQKQSGRDSTGNLVEHFLKHFEDYANSCWMNSRK